MKKTPFILVAILQGVVALVWTVVLLLLADGLWRYVGLIPAVVLCASVACTLLSTRLIDEGADLAAELQRIKTMTRLDVDVMTLKDRLAHFETLRQWGIITEEELKEKRRALLDLEQPAPAKRAEDPSRQSTPSARTGAIGPASTVGNLREPRPRRTASAKRTRKPVPHQ